MQLKNKIYNIGILASLLISTTCFSQSVQRCVIGSAGKTMSSNGFTLRTTVGEAVVAKGSGSGYKLNQGFQHGLFINSPLPITGLDFTARRMNSSQVHLQWKTLTEINNKGFHIERKLDNETEFTTLRFIPSLSFSGNSNTALIYSHQDENAFTGSTYYRLKQEDIDGKFTYSLIRVVQGEVASSVTLKVWPIPAKDYVNVAIEGSNKIEEVTLVDMNGKTIQSIRLSNQMQLGFDLRGLSTGIYFVKTKGDDKLMQKVIVE